MTVVIHHLDQEIAAAHTMGLPHKETAPDPFIAYDQIDPDAYDNLIYVVTASEEGRLSVLPCLPNRWSPEEEEPAEDNRDEPVIVQWDWWAPPCPNQPHLRGVSDWEMLKEAVDYANNITVVQFLQYTVHSAVHEDDFMENEELVFKDESHYYQPDWTITLCPGTVIQSPPPRWWRRGDNERDESVLYVNSKHLTIRCGNVTRPVDHSEGSKEKECRWETRKGPSHIRFGPHADVTIQGPLTFAGAKVASLVLKDDGASVSTRDIHWEDNYFLAKLNSSSFLEFSRCHRSDDNIGLSMYGNFHIRSADMS